MFKDIFYGSPVEDGFINGNWDKVYFAFTACDNTNAYCHSGYIEDKKLI